MFHWGYRYLAYKYFKMKHEIDYTKEHSLGLEYFLNCDLCKRRVNIMSRIWESGLVSVPTDGIRFGTVVGIIASGKRSKCKVKKQDGYWWVISSCGNFKEQYSSWNQVLRRLGEIK